MTSAIRVVFFTSVLLVSALGLASAGTLVVGPVREQLVEGHVTFTVIETVANTSVEESYAAAVAVLVRELRSAQSGTRFPGVLWFNDQYLIPPSSNAPNAVTYRYPCTGAVLAVNEGDPDPRTANFTNAAYVESYRIRDPNDNTWTIDKWNISNRFVWTVALYGEPRQTTAGTPDDGNCSGANPYTDSGLCRGPHRYATREICPVGGPGGEVADTGDHGGRYPCGFLNSTGCSALQYNAVLYFLMEDLDVPDTPKDHAEGSADRQGDVAGCHAMYGNYTGPYANGAVTSWPCPDNDDDREGNSHAYHPNANSLLLPYAGKNNHGGSAVCDTDGVPRQPSEPDFYYTGDYECHATRNIDIYYGAVPNPTVPRYYRVLELVGTAAPHHCHEQCP